VWKDRDDRGEPEVGEGVRVTRIVGRQVDEEAAGDRLGDKAPI